MWKAAWYIEQEQRDSQLLFLAKEASNIDLNFWRRRENEEGQIFMSMCVFMEGNEWEMDGRDIQ